MASKSRKSLATFAAVSLGLGSVFVGSAPAQAVVAVSLAPSDGTSYSVESTYNMSLETRITNSALSGGSESIKFLITDLDAGLDYASWTNGSDTEGSYPVDEDGFYDVESDMLLVDSYVAASDNVASAQTLTLVPEETDTFSVTVQAWVDFNDNNVIDEGEAQSSVRTVTFVNEDDIDWSLSFAAPSLGDDELTATLTSSPALNFDVMGDDPEVAFASYSAAGGGNKFTALDSAVEAADGVFTDGEMADEDGVYAANETVASGTYTAVALFNGVEVTSQAYRQVGLSVADDTVDGLELVKTANTNYDVYRVGTDKVSLTVSFEDEDNDPVPTGTVVTVTLSDEDLADDTSIKSGGKTLEADGDDVSYTTTTDADGVATIVVTGLSDQEDSDTFEVSVRSGSVVDNLYVDAEDTYVDDFDTLYSMGLNSVVKIAEGGSTTVKFFAYDQFDQPLGSDYRVKLTDGDDVTKVANFSGQLATFSITDDADVDETWTASLQMYDDFNWSNTEDYADFDNLVIGDSNAPANVTTSDDQTGDDSVGRAYWPEIAASDDRIEAGSYDDDYDDNADYMTGIVTDATGVGTYSAVTISAPGVYFDVYASDGTWVMFKESVTVYTDETGFYEGIYAVSNIAGEVTVTVTAGSASTEFVIEFDGAYDDEGTDLTVNVANAVAGSTMIVSGSLVDAYGNPVAYGDLTIDYDGPGFAANTPDETDANGNYKFAVLLGANDVVSGTVTVTYTEADDGDDIIVVRNLAGDTKVNVGSFKGYVALYAKGYAGQKMSAIVAGKWVVVQSLASDFERVVRFTGAGYDIVVTIYIDGVMINTFNVTTK